VQLIEPLGDLDFLALQAHTRLVWIDSGYPVGDDLEIARQEGQEAPAAGMAWT